MISQERIFVAAGALVAFMLQLFVAPHIGVLSATPNFVVAYTLAVAVVRPASFGAVMPFVLGLAFDFACGGPVGGMAFLLTAFSVLAAWVFLRVDNDSLFMALAVLALAVLLVEVSYMVIVLASGLSASFGEALVCRMLPCFLYDLVLACILYPVVSRFARPNVVSRTELTQLR